MKKLLIVTACLLALSEGGTEAQPRSIPSGWWIGSYTLGGSGAITFEVAGKRAVVALGLGHAGVQKVQLTRRGSRLRFQLPGRPSPVIFSGVLRGNAIRGTVRQGAVRGSLRLRRGEGRAMVASGLYSADAGVLGVVDDPYGPARLVDLDCGGVNALYPSGKAFSIGSGFATRAPARGTARFGVDRAVVAGARATREATRQLEVRFRSGASVLSGTLTLPPGPGQHAAVAFVHGSGPTTRAYLPDLQALLVRHGVAVLAYDKRGTGQSGGSFPGESPTAAAIGALARDAEAATRFLAAQPEIDRARVGLAGHSQAGWIMPLAASREPAIRFLVVFSGPAVTADENDLYQALTGQGERSQQLSDEEIDAQVLRRGPGGVDPVPWIRQLRIPALWLYGGLDKHIPARLSMRRLEPLAHEPGRDFSIEVFPNANHALVETQTGLTSEMLGSDRFAPGLFGDVAAWLRKHGLSPPRGRETTEGSNCS
jgi:pimeloyl-ACP methyl ester carboxylesterase